MSPETEQPLFTDMRESVKTWIKWRPTMHHTQDSLVDILTAELRELRLAQEQKRPEAQITAEVGDVLFSTLALDNGKGEFSSQYAAISEYCGIVGIKLDQLFAQTLDKNDANYPLYFFQRTSPFENAQDAISCLRVLRFSIGGIAGIKRAWQDVEQILNGLPFMDAYDVTGKFRDYVKHRLIKILNDKTTNRQTRKLVRNLLNRGAWDMVPLDLQIDNPANHVILF